ncbi:hypothetical protein GCM10007981_06660 [Thermocladium modestius]|uniref:RNA methyltransferase n=1 Tax=Thermocladium modestius TaxID=62609 RepID=A0A830GTV6_9CREN|nr:class I SAM-dependent methyltransferase [Thermocladium modestius]GGP20070.1 hypothetical protein GCM10007981_06660 [Thermocladium modestius]
MVYDVPFVPTPEVVVKRMLQLANVKPGEVLYDLGCGDGRIIITAARDFGARAFGVEIRKDLYEQCVRRIKELGLEDRITVINGNFFEVPVSDADVVTMYLLTSVNERLRPKLEKELRPATRVVSHDFEMIGWKPVIAEDLYEEWRSHKIYLYKMPGAEIPIPSRPLTDVDEKYRDVAMLIDGNNSIERIASKLNTTVRNVRNVVQELQKLGYVSEVKVVK